MTVMSQGDILVSVDMKKSLGEPRRLLLSSNTDTKRSDVMQISADPADIDCES